MEKYTATELEAWGVPELIGYVLELQAKVESAIETLDTIVADLEKVKEL